ARLRAVDPRVPAITLVDQPVAPGLERDVDGLLDHLGNLVDEAGRRTRTDLDPSAVERLADEHEVDERRRWGGRARCDDRGARRCPPGRRVLDPAAADLDEGGGAEPDQARMTIELT